MINKVSTKDMTREQWLEARRNSIGGSDAASILGLSKYNSAYALWCDKTGKVVPEDISNVEAVRLGNDLEQYVADRFMEATGKKVRRENFIITNTDYPFAHANPDRMVIGEKAGLECKTTSSYEIEKELKDGIIPPYWYCQMTHYMMVTGAERWYLAAIVFGKGFYHMCLERNDAEIAALAEIEKDFWNLVITDTAPPIDGTESTSNAINTIFDKSDGTSIDLTGVASHLQMYKIYKANIEELAEKLEEEANAIKDYMGAAEKGTSSYGNVSWKSCTRSTLNKKKVEAKYGKLDDSFYTTSTYRTFKVTFEEDK